MHEMPQKPKHTQEPKRAGLERLKSMAMSVALAGMLGSSNHVSKTEVPLKELKTTTKIEVSIQNNGTLLNPSTGEIIEPLDIFLGDRRVRDSENLSTETSEATIDQVQNENIGLVTLRPIDDNDISIYKSTLANLLTQDPEIQLVNDATTGDSWLEFHTKNTAQIIKSHTWDGASIELRGDEDKTEGEAPNFVNSTK